MINKKKSGELGEFSELDEFGELGGLNSLNFLKIHHSHLPSTQVQVILTSAIGGGRGLAGVVPA
jgi:hypothetical protein